MVVIPRAAKAWFLRLYEVPFLAAVVWFSWTARMKSFAPNVTSEHVYFVGTDPYYHFRVILATVANFPRTLRYDPFTHYPNGTGTGQFGSLFDQGAAALAILLGKTDRMGIAEVTAWYPALLGALVFIPFYFLARLLIGRIGALFATTALMLIPGEFLVRSLATYSDHHIAEAIGMVVATLAAFNAIEVAARHSHVIGWPPKWRELAWPLASVVLGALGIVLYFLVWPPAILVVGVFGIVLAITMAYEHVRGADTWYLAFGGGGPFLLAGLLLLPKAESTQLNFNTFSLLQPVACLLLAALLVGFHVASQALLRARANRAVLPVAGATFGLVGFFSLKVLSPGLYGSILWGASWVTGIGVKREILTIAEAQPAEWSQLTGEYALLVIAFLFALLGLAITVIARRRRADLLLLVWSLLMYQAARTQVRFNYYLALVVALAFGWLAFMVADATGFNRALAAWFGRDERVAEAREKAKGRRTRAVSLDEERLKPWQPLAVGAVALLLLPSLVIPEAASNGERATRCGVGVEIYPVWVLGTCFAGPDQGQALWVEALDWMRAGTPTVGVAITDLPERPPPGEWFDYPDNAYGVLSWWDYGHWIEVEGERPPVANPFQQAAPFASCYFTAASEERAERFLTAWSERSFDRGPTGARCEDVELPAASEDLENPVRYVMIDDEMAAGKFYAITVWAKYDDYANDDDCREFRRADTGDSVRLNYVGEGYYRTMLSRLYVDDAQNLQHYRLVHETATAAVIGSLVRLGGDAPASRCGPERGQITRFNDLLNRDVRDDPDVFHSLSRNELAPTGAANEFIYDGKIAGAVKTFEHVKGARVVGRAEPNALVRVAIPLKSDTTGREWTWESSVRAGADGAFALVVPYATSEYVAPAAGGTDYTVRATSPALVYVGEARAPSASASVAVPDAAVLEGREVPVALG